MSPPAQEHPSRHRVLTSKSRSSWYEDSFKAIEELASWVMKHAGGNKPCKSEGHYLYIQRCNYLLALCMSALHADDRKELARRKQELEAWVLEWYVLAEEGKVPRSP